ncbi:hypothetical protein [Granulicatella balaenopterae]|nr:hypothetical protein [Granulicatella balaenopterae]
MKMSPTAIKVLLTIPAILIIILCIFILKNNNSETDTMRIKVLAVALIIASLYWSISLWI